MAGFLPARAQVEVGLRLMFLGQMADACNAKIALNRDIKNITGKIMKIKILTDSVTLFYVIIPNASTVVQRLKRDIKEPLEENKEDQINVILWLRGY